MFKSWGDFGACLIASFIGCITVLLPLGEKVTLSFAIWVFIVLFFLSSALLFIGRELGEKKDNRNE